MGTRRITPLPGRGPVFATVAGAAVECKLTGVAIFGETGGVVVNRSENGGRTQLILDGGLGTELEKKGCKVQDSLWSARVLLENPEIVEQVHREYLEAGADCIIAASYQVSFDGFCKAGLSSQDTVNALQASVAVARRAREAFQTTVQRRPAPILAASIGPYGAALGDGSEFHGNYDCGMHELREFHSARLAILQESGPDILACETIPSLAEAEVILHAVRERSSIAGWFSFTCRDGLHTAHGERLRECARALEGESVVAAIGVNCTPPEFIASLVQEIRSVTQKPIVVYPNSGQTWDGKNRCWKGERTSQDLGTLALEWRRLGATWIGGCCGTSPDDIRRIRSSLSADHC